MRVLFSALLLLTLALLCAAQTPLPDSLKPASETMFVIPAGPTAGNFTPNARLTILDTVAGWAKIQVEGWVPVTSVANRFPAEKQIEPQHNSSPAIKSTPHQCEAITKKGKRCSRRAVEGSHYCWQHQNK
jgi:hypothetical protein